MGAPPQLKVTFLASCHSFYQLQNMRATRRQTNFHHLLRYARKGQVLFISVLTLNATAHAKILFNFFPTLCAEKLESSLSPRRKVLFI